METFRIWDEYLEWPEMDRFTRRPWQANAEGKGTRKGKFDAVILTGGRECKCSMPAVFILRTAASLGALSDLQLRHET
jgi:hypothetical protein